MINKVWKTEFEVFLISVGVIDLFNFNYNNEHINFHIDIFEVSNHVYDYLINAFDWVFTDEGESFWDNINDLWYDYIEKHDLQKYDIVND